MSWITRNRVCVVAAVLLVVFCAAPVSAQVPSDSFVVCSAVSGGASPIVRAEGLAELVGDVILNCSGGRSTPPNTFVPTINVQVVLNTDVSSRLFNGPVTEALLLIDEPGAPSNPGTPQIPCTDTGPLGTPGVCPTWLGVGGSTGVVPGGWGPNPSPYGVSGRPNVFQALWSPAQPSALTWLGIPFDPPGTAGVRTLRITNIRANAKKLGQSSVMIPNSIVAVVSVTGWNLLEVNNPPVTLAYIRNGLTSPAATTPARLKRCVSANPGIASDTSLPLDTGGQNGAQFSITLRESFVYAFKTKNPAIDAANNVGASQFSYPPDQNQNMPGLITYGETGFFNGATDQGGAPLAGSFPSINGLNRAGQADQGTRFYLAFSNPPPGVQLFVPVTLPLGNQPQTGVAKLVATEAAGAGPYQPVEGNSSGWARASGLAVYELLRTEPVALEWLTIPVAAAYVAPVPAGTITVQSGFAPISTVTTSSISAPVPRFGDVHSESNAFRIQLCGPSATGDVNEDGAVDCKDIGVLRASLGKRNGQPGFDARADINNDGAVDIRDLAFVSQKLPSGTRCN